MAQGITLSISGSLTCIFNPRARELWIKGRPGMRDVLYLDRASVPCLRCPACAPISMVYDRSVPVELAVPHIHGTLPDKASYLFFQSFSTCFQVYISAYNELDTNM